MIHQYLYGGVSEIDTFVRHEFTITFQFETDNERLMKAFEP